MRKLPLTIDTHAMNAETSDWYGMISTLKLSIVRYRINSSGADAQLSRNAMASAMKLYVNRSRIHSK